MEPRTEPSARRSARFASRAAARDAKRAERQAEGTAPAPTTVTFNQVETALKDLPVDLLPTVYAYIVELLDAERAKDIPNDITLQAFADSDAGRNMHEYQTVDEMFQKVLEFDDSDD